MSLIRGAEFKHQWPTTTNVLSIKTTKQLQEQIAVNPLVTVSEKLDGSNLCISSKGWIASRRIIIVEDFNKDDLSKIQFNGTNLSKLEDMKCKLLDIHVDLVSRTERSDFQTLVYGEWLQHRTATTQEDQFNYAKRNLESNHFYAFGLAVLFDNELSSEELAGFEAKTIETMGWTQLVTENPNQFVVFNFNQNLNQFFQGKSISTVSIIEECSLETALTDSRLIEKLIKQEVEGFVLTAKDFLFKWKFTDQTNKYSQVGAIAALKAEELNPIQDRVIEALEKVCLHSEPAEKKQPRRKPDKQLFSKLFKSAETKYPKFEELCYSVTQEEIIELSKKFQTDFEKELQADLIELGYQQNSEYEKDIHSFVNSIFERRANNCIQRLKYQKPKQDGLQKKS